MLMPFPHSYKNIKRTSEQNREKQKATGLICFVFIIKTEGFLILVWSSTA